MEVIGSARYVKSTPDKIRILADMINHKEIDMAIDQLNFSTKDAAKYVILVLKQAKDQIKDKGLKSEDFKIKTVQVDEGPKLKRRRIRHQGRATAILKRMAHIRIVLTNDLSSKLKAKSSKDKAKLPEKIINKKNSEIAKSTPPKIKKIKKESK